MVGGWFRCSKSARVLREGDETRCGWLRVFGRHNAYAIRASEELCLMDQDNLSDNVLHRLLGMGLFDWVDKDDCLHQATQVSRISTTMSLRIIERLIQEEDKVRSCNPCSSLMLTDTTL